MTNTITLPRATVEQAIQALKVSTSEDVARDIARRQAIATLSDVLAPNKAEPVAMVTRFHDLGGEFDWVSPPNYRPPVGAKFYAAQPQQQAEPVQEPFDGLATELFVVAQRSPADDGFSDTIDRIESWLREHFSTQPQRNPLTDEQVKELFMKDLGTDYLDDFVCGIRAAEAAHGIKEGA